MKRWLILGAGVFLIVVALAVYTLYTSLDFIIARAIEKYGSEITQSEVRLDAAEISLRDGQAALKGFSVGNPEGFEADHSFRVMQIKVTLDVGTVTQDPIVVKEISIDRPAVTYELGPRGSNIDAIQRNVDAYTGAGGEGAQGATGPKMIIENLYIKGGEVTVGATVLKGRTLTARLPDIHLKNIGKGTAGAAPGEVAQRIMARVTRAVGSAVGSLSLDAVLSAVGEAGKPARKIAERGLGGIAGGTEDPPETIKKGMGAAGEKLKRLFD